LLIADCRLPIADCRPILLLGSENEIGFAPVVVDGAVFPVKNVRVNPVLPVTMNPCPAPTMICSTRRFNIWKI
jgi:hypothetical protein